MSGLGLEFRVYGAVPAQLRRMPGQLQRSWISYSGIRDVQVVNCQNGQDLVSLTKELRKQFPI